MKLTQKVLDFCKALEDKKAINIVVCDTTKISNLFDYAIIATATSTTHTKSLADYLEEISAQHGYSLINREGFNLSEWIVLDFDDVFVHIFTQNKREYYNLEKLLNEGNNQKSYDKIKKEIIKQEKVKQEKVKQQKKKELNKEKHKKIKEKTKK